LFKQMINIYGIGFPESERITYEPIVYSNIVTMMQTLCVASEKLATPGRRVSRVL